MPLTLKPDAVDAFSRAWSSKGIGWVSQVIDSTEKGVTVFAYYGSSAYDTKQMTALVDRLIQDAKALDIDVISEKEKSLLLEEWH
jgi:phosphoribosyl-dephospho-CoA transferase